VSKRSLLVDGLCRAKQLSLRGMDEQECLTLATMHDKVCSITDDQEQERMTDYECYFDFLRSAL